MEVSTKVDSDRVKDMSAREGKKLFRLNWKFISDISELQELQQYNTQ